MAEWVLVLTIFAPYHGGSSMVTIPGFRSELVCLREGERWKRSVGRPPEGASNSAICMRPDPDAK